MTTTYGGIPIFGYAVHITPVLNPNASQVAQFFGVQGVQSLDGGMRGRVFQVEGLLAGTSTALVVAAGAAFENYADGVARILTDTAGIACANVTYRNEFSWEGPFLWSPTLAAWCRPYKCLLHGLT